MYTINYTISIGDEINIFVEATSSCTWIINQHISIKVALKIFQQLVLLQINFYNTQAKEEKLFDMHAYINLLRSLHWIK